MSFYFMSCTCIFNFFSHVIVFCFFYLVPFADYQNKGLHRLLCLQKLQSGPCAGRCGAGVRLLWAQWVWKCNLCSASPLRVTHTVSCPAHHKVVRSSVCPAARKATRTYNSDSLHNMDSCFFCGSDCGRCRPGLALTVSSQLSAHSVSITTCSWMYLILGVIAVLMVL